ncbi:MAG: transglycosylase domain-containing protein [Bacteroidota bacterium]
MDTQQQPDLPQDKNKWKKGWSALKERWSTFQFKMPERAQLFKWAKWSFGLGLGFALLLLFFIRVGIFGRLPSKTELLSIQNDNASEVYSIDGQLLGKYFIENRTNIPYDAISPDIVNALVATEDARFFEHKGVDTRAWLRVLFKTILLNDGSSGGGSTLSQQLAKNLYPRKQFWLLSTPINKVREMFIARRLESVYSKDALLSLYLNTVPFGGNIYGVEVAARQLFGRSATDIKTEEAAVLVGMLKANTYYNPVRNPERAQQRRNVVLQQMAKYKYLAPSVCDSLKQIPLKVDYHSEGNNQGLATYFREHLRQELAEKVKHYVKEDGSSYNLYTDGLKIYTTIHSRMQDYAEQAVTAHLKKLQKDFDQHWKKKKPWGDDRVIEKLMAKSRRYQRLKEQGYSEAAIKKSFAKAVNMKVFTWEGTTRKKISPLDSVKYYYCLLNAGFLAVDPGSGAIRAWVGGIDHQYFKYDHVKSRRQVGSIFKPLVYAQALESGLRPCNYFNNNLVTYTEYEDWKPQNADGKYGGVYSMAGGLSKSVNSVAVDLIMQTGIDSVRLLAKNMGISTKIPKVPAIALGAVDASLYDMVEVYGTFANRGKQVDNHYLLRIEDQSGELIIDFKEEREKRKEQVLGKDFADIMIKMMEAVVDSGTARRLRYQFGLYGDIAGKTGTTQSHADGWFLGFTPDLVAGAWVGGESPKVRFRSLRLGQGANTALPIWGRFMAQVYKDREFRKWKNHRFVTPSREVEMMMDCPPFLEEKPLLVEEEEGINAAIDRLLESLAGLGKKKKKNQQVNVKPRKKETKAEREARKKAERIKKKNEKLRKKREKQKRKAEKKKKRKKFFDKLFGRKKD